MSTIELEPSLQPGQPAPDLTLLAVEREGTVSLSDYRGKSALLLGLFRGLYCPMCRRRIVQMGLARDAFHAQGVETLSIVGTKLEHTRLYYRFHPTRLPLAADPAMSAARAFNVPKPRVTPQLLQGYQSILVDPDGELVQPVPVTKIAATLNERDGYEMNETDREDNKQQWRWDRATQLMGRFLIDRDGIVRWVDIECGRDGLAGIGKFSGEEALQAAVRAL